ncbi:hypothetical protein D3C75_1217950 [compost metagenome]
MAKLNAIISKYMPELAKLCLNKGLNKVNITPPHSIEAFEHVQSIDHLLIHNDVGTVLPIANRE